MSVLMIPGGKIAWAPMPVPLRPSVYFFAAGRIRDRQREVAGSGIGGAEGSARRASGGRGRCRRSHIAGAGVADDLVVRADGGGKFRGRRGFQRGAPVRGWCCRPRYRGSERPQRACVRHCSACRRQRRRRPGRPTILQVTREERSTAGDPSWLGE